MLHMARIITECESVDVSSGLPLNTYRLRGFILAGMGGYLFHLKRLTVPVERLHVPVHTEPQTSHH